MMLTLKLFQILQPFNLVIYIYTNKTPGCARVVFEIRQADFFCVRIYIMGIHIATDNLNITY